MGETGEGKTSSETILGQGIHDMFLILTHTNDGMETKGFRELFKKKKILEDITPVRWKKLLYLKLPEANYLYGQ